MEIFGYQLETIIFWHWWVLASVFFVLEILSMSFFFLWIGVAAVLIGALVFFAPGLPWEAQICIWAVVSVAMALGWRVYKKNNPNAESVSDQPLLNKRGDQYIGRTFTLETPIENGFGKVKVDDSIWKIESETDMPAGTKIKVTAIEGTILQVEKV